MIGASVVHSKHCGVCGGSYPSDALFCPLDGRPLESAGSPERQPEVDAYLGQEISGHIEIRELVGVGAMGRVYRAFQRGIDRDVAVKILHRELSTNPQLVSRFTREAKVASVLQHPNVVQVFLAGQLPDRAMYMVMEYLDGLSLQSALAAAGGALPLGRALHIILQLCDATGEAHAQGIVHRDLKPENVMLVRRGSDSDFVKVLDFGIARISWGDKSIATAAGLIFGTARYISPEGARGDAVGPAGDVYSLATLLYQMLAGRTPFDGQQAVGLLVQQIHDPAPPLRSIPRAAYVPEPIAALVMQNLAKAPSAREPDARSFGQALLVAAREAGLSTDDFSRPLLGRDLGAMQMPPETRTKQLALTPSPAAASQPSAAAAEAAALGATAKWSPPTEFHARVSRASDAPRERAPRTLIDEPRRDSSVEATIDDAAPQPVIPEPSSPPLATPEPHRASQTDVGRAPARGGTAPGDPDGPKRTHYEAPAVEATSAPLAYPPARPSSPRPASDAGVAHEEPRGRGWSVVVLCFALGALLATAWAWQTGKLGGSGADHERFVARATEAMFAQRFGEPPGESVKDITDEGLRRFPNDPRLRSVRVRSAGEVLAKATAQRAAGDVAEALRLAKLASELDPTDASAARLVEQYERELAAYTAPVAPMLPAPPLAPPATPAPKPAAAPKPQAPSAPKSAPAPKAAPPARRATAEAALGLSRPEPKVGQTVDMIARVTPGDGDVEAPGFTIVGPGMLPGGVRVSAQSAGPGMFKASYAFREAGRFEIVFRATVDGDPVAASRTVSVEAPPVAAPPAPAPPAPAPTTPPAGSVRWM